MPEDPLLIAPRPPRGVPRFSGQGVLRIIAALCLPVFLHGCAHVYVDADGTRHVLGLVHLELPAESTAKPGGEALRSQSFGLSVTSSAVGQAVVLGYSDTTLAFVRDNVVVTASGLLLDPKPSVSDDNKE